MTHHALHERQTRLLDGSAGGNWRLPSASRALGFTRHHHGGAVINHIRVLRKVNAVAAVARDQRGHHLNYAHPPTVLAVCAPV